MRIRHEGVRIGPGQAMRVVVIVDLEGRDLSFVQDLPLGRKGEYRSVLCEAWRRIARDALIELEAANAQD